MLAAGCATSPPAPVEDRAARGRAAGRAVAPAARCARRRRSRRRPPTYTVKRGDTLHQIALDSGLDYRELAAWNNIENVNVIRVGQVLRLARTRARAPPVAQEVRIGRNDGAACAPRRSIVEAPARHRCRRQHRVASTTALAGRAAARGPRVAANLKTSPKAIKEPYSDQAVRELTLAASAVARAAPMRLQWPPRRRARRAESEPRASATPSAPPPATAAPPHRPRPRGDADRLDWAWPAKGKVIAGFSETANLKGIDIAGTAGAGGARERRRAGRLRGQRAARLRQAHHHQAQRHVPVRVRAQPRNPRQGRRSRSRADRRSPRWATPTPTR